MYRVYHHDVRGIVGGGESEEMHHKTQFVEAACVLVLKADRVAPRSPLSAHHDVAVWDETGSLTTTVLRLTR